MFKCERCKISTKKEYRIVTERREKRYHYYVVTIRRPYGKVETIITEDKRVVDNLDKGDKFLRDYTSKGWEIVKETIICKQCYNKEKIK